MYVWNVLHAARWKYRTQKLRKKSPSSHHRTTLSGYIFATKACIDNRKRKRQYLLHMSSQYTELRPINGWNLLASLRHPCKFQWVSHLGSITAQHSSKRKGKERKSIYIAPILVHTHTLKALRHGSHSFTCKQHHTCLSFVSVHQMAPPQLRQQTSTCSFTTHLSTPKGWKAEFAWLVDL